MQLYFLSKISDLLQIEEMIDIKYLLLLFPLAIYVYLYKESYSHKAFIHETTKRLDDLTKSTVSQITARKKILMWTNYFQSRKVWNSIFKRIISGDCEESRCEITLDHYEIATADAVLFNAYNLRDITAVPIYLRGNVYDYPQESTRSNDQIYIFYSMESPLKLDRKYLSKLPNNYFNWTMGYRTDSDVFEPYGTVTKKSSLSPRNTVRYTTQKELRKKKLAVWISSSCYRYVPFVRERFIEELRKITKIDIFGNCGKICDNQTGIKMFNKTFGTSPCEKKVKDYQFYLTLENSLCKDYATEKIFKAWNLGAIPVVFGDANYSAFAPPKSYIDYRDFKSASDLIKYMKKIARDAKLYNQYFKWKEDYDIVVGNPYDPFVCDLCRKLHETPAKRTSKSYENIYDWFVLQGNCKDSLDGLIELN